MVRSLGTPLLSRSWFRIAPKVQATRFAERNETIVQTWWTAMQSSWDGSTPRRVKISLALFKPSLLLQNRYILKVQALVWKDKITVTLADSRHIAIWQPSEGLRQALCHLKAISEDWNLSVKWDWIIRYKTSQLKFAENEWYFNKTQSKCTVYEIASITGTTKLQLVCQHNPKYIINEGNSCWIPQN